MGKNMSKFLICVNGILIGFNLYAILKGCTNGDTFQIILGLCAISFPVIALILCWDL